MKIIGPLVIDLSLWNDHIIVDELVVGGVKSVILGLYKHWDGSKFVLNTNCQRILNQLKNSSFLIQSYYYYYPENDPVADADWYTNIILTSGVNIRFSWSDCENAQAVMGADVRSEKYRIFTDRCATKFQKTGVYTNKDFIVGKPSIWTWPGVRKSAVNIPFILLRLHHTASGHGWRS